jgi:hypothetical protein
MIENIIYLIVLVSAIFFGITLYKMCIEEIKNWKKRMIIFLIILFLTTIILIFSNLYIKRPIIVAILFIIIMILTILAKDFMKEHKTIKKITLKKRRNI